MPLPALVTAMLEALDEPALLVSGERTIAANSPALDLLGGEIVGQNVRFAIRQPPALEAILAAREGQVEVPGIAGVDRTWAVTTRRLAPGTLLVRLTDRSAERAAERAQVDFVANASHELRTPLAAVLGYAETLADEGEVDEALRRRFGEHIHRQAHRMLRIITDLMSLSRIEADRFAPPTARVSLAEVARESAEAAQPLAEERGCRIALDVGEDLAAIPGDTAQLRQLVDNLLHNAIRYGCRKEGDQVRLVVDELRDWQRLRVLDKGEGIASHHLPRLTQRFYRVDAARSRDGGGTGLGLAIVQQIVERHGGKLSIRSQPGLGTEVEVRLPRARRPLS